MASDDLWYREPQHPSSRPAPPSPAPVALPLAASPQRSPANLLLGGAAAAVVGSVLPWATLTSSLVGAISDGIDGVGVITGALGLALAIAGLRARTVPWTMTSTNLAAVATVAIGAVALFDHLSRTAGESSSALGITVLVGIGLYLTGLGAAVACAGVVGLELFRRRHIPA